MVKYSNTRILKKFRLQSIHLIVHIISMRTFLLAFLFAAPGFLAAQSNLQLVGQLSYAPLSLAGCWHYVDSTGGEYALVGTSVGLSIVDLNNPAQPVERFAVPGLPNTWREVKTWAGFAYVGSEALGSGITIVDLRSLPDTIYWKVWTGDSLYTNQVDRSHTVQAENGFLYIFGGGNVTNGATIADLSDPWNPRIVGIYTTNYVHDGFIRGDTLWTSEIYQGQFGVVDISDKTALQLLTTQPTPGAFNHNTGLSDDSKYLFTTDEKYGSPLASFDVSDLNNITLLDQYFPSQKPTNMVHNVRVLGNYLINPSYGGQLTIVDATHPDNLIETAWSVVGTSLVWDADPYLPSGIVFSTARNEGLFVYQPTYEHAAWLEGQVTDAATGLPLGDAKVFLLETPNADTTFASGNYKTGAASSGTYHVEVVRAGYVTKTIPAVVLTSGEITVLNVALDAVVGTDQALEEVGIRISPTLFSNHLQITLPPDSRFTSAQLLDAQGKILLESRLSGTTTELDVAANLPKAAYVLQLRGKNGEVRSFRVVRE